MSVTDQLHTHTSALQCTKPPKGFLGMNTEKEPSGDHNPQADPAGVDVPQRIKKGKTAAFCTAQANFGTGNTLSGKNTAAKPLDHSTLPTHTFLVRWSLSSQCCHAGIRAQLGKMQLH